ncbi:PREDICTED: uncharacterized protein LOC105154652 [Acromyrmex echinatior]|uniref:uncharacterized protein LOC105154652 n=1 Tax=Acromyrmex echinatior TaxID=103372 RepID=UPI000580FF9D|nr:PREDICTED: uncharacterized protein LOC105154652 [Acromyrmex echinatior]
MVRLNLTGIRIEANTFLTEYANQMQELTEHLKHFENSQFESHRSDGWKKLKPNTIPTLFDVLNPPSMIDPQKSLYKKLGERAEFNPVLELVDILRISESEEDELSRLRLENEKLLRQLQTHELLVIENQKLRDQINTMEKIKQSFLNDNQIKMLEQGRILHWPNNSIVKALN